MPERDESALPSHLELHGDGIQLREWTDGDLPVMVELFDDPEIDRWTPLSSPFGLDAARNYLDRARVARAENRAIQLAVTRDGGRPCGEVVLFRGEDRGEIELGYSIGVRYRRQGLAARALRVLTDYARQSLAHSRLLLRIEPENIASAAVARAVGYRPAADQPVTRELKGRRMSLHTWQYPQPRPLAEPLS